MHRLRQVYFHLRRSNSKWTQPTGFSTNIKIYNPLLKGKTDLITQREKLLTWYSCGPTVYDSAHLGHACCYLHYDIIRRILEDFFGLNVVFVLGVTDIGQEVLNRAEALGVDFKQVAVRYEQEFFKDMTSLNVKPATVVTRVTDHIPDIIRFVSGIMDKGYGYAMADGSVNFSVGKYSAYGKLGNPHEERDSEKQSSRDFALWKSVSKAPSWDSPWGKGVPGWHIECSAMASKYLGKRIDIHSGGIDLRFPHHENEEAQSCTYHETNQWVNYWLHSGHLHLQDGIKMSKSLQNTVSVSEFLDKYTGNQLRMLCLQIPYRNGIEFGDEVMARAVSIDKKLSNFVKECESYTKGDIRAEIDENTLIQELTLARKKVFDHLSDDFDTASALEVLTKLVHTTNVMLRNKAVVDETLSPSVAMVSNYVSDFLLKCGFDSSRAPSSDVHLEKILESAVHFRAQVRSTALTLKPDQSAQSKKSLLTSCDSFRDNLKSVGIELKDKTGSSTWAFSSEQRKIQ